MDTRDGLVSKMFGSVGHQWKTVLILGLTGLRTSQSDVYSQRNSNKNPQMHQKNGTKVCNFFKFVVCLEYLSFPFIICFDKRGKGYKVS